MTFGSVAAENETLTVEALAARSAAKLSGRRKKKATTATDSAPAAAPLNEDEFPSLDTARALRGGGPWGQGFPEPVFDGDFHIADVRIVGGKHLKLRLRMADAADGGGGPSAVARDEPVEAIAFGYVGGAAEDPQLRGGARIQAAYRLEINEYLGSERLQLNCQHLRLI